MFKLKHEIFRSGYFIGRPKILDVDQKRYEKWALHKTNRWEWWILVLREILCKL